MNGEEKTFSMYLNMGETQRDASAHFLNNNRAGVLISMAIHALLIALFLLQPAAKMSAVKTFHISFSAGGGSFPQNSPSPAQNLVKAHIAPAPPKKAALQSKAVVAPPDVVRKATAAPLPPVSPKIAATKPEETTLPLVSDDPKASKRDEFIAAVGNVSSPAEPAAVSGAVQHGWGDNLGSLTGTALESGMGSGFGDGSGNGLGDGSGNGSRNGASSGAESGAPLETRFGETNAPGFIHQAMPVYPPLARRHGKEGRVVLTILIDQAGKVQKIDVTEPAGYGLTEAAIEAVKRSTFAPAYVNGKKVSSRAVLPIRFKLE